MARLLLLFWLTKLVLGVQESEVCPASSDDLSAMLQTRLKIDDNVAMNGTPLAKPATVIREKVGADDACAVCFIGELRSLNETADSLRRNFLEVIASEGVLVDVFIAAARRGPFNIADFGLTNVTSGRGHRVVLRDFRFQQEPPVQSFEDLIMKVPDRALQHYNETWGIWLSPALGRHGNSLRFHRHAAECLEMIKNAEMSSNMRYKWIVRSRPDFLWLAPHPPLSLMALDRLWTPDTEDAGGQVNDRHMVGSRDDIVNGLLRQWEYLITGHQLIYSVHNTCDVGGKMADMPCRSYMKSEMPERGQATSCETRSCGRMRCYECKKAGMTLHQTTMIEMPVCDECFARSIIDALSIHVGRFPTVAYVSACPSWSLRCFRQKAFGGKLKGKTYHQETRTAKANAALWRRGLDLPSRSCYKRASWNTLGISHDCDVD